MVLDSCASGWSTCEVYIEQDFSEEVCIDNSDYALLFFLLLPICSSCFFIQRELYTECNADCYNSPFPRI